MFERNLDSIICEMDGKHPDMLMDVKVIKMTEGDSETISLPEKEMALLLLDGTVQFTYEGNRQEGSRGSLFDEKPSCLHVPKNVEVTITAMTDCEVLFQATTNEESFVSKWYGPDDVRADIFGGDALQGTAYRVVRTVFDYDNAPYSKLVIGEVINYPGRWSSYTPHHHPQPEVYYYRFDKPQGFGVSIIGEESFVISDNSASFIPGGLVHPQVTAPGYAMYYCWMIRHFDNDPWTSRTNDEKHTWMLEDESTIWKGL